MHFFYLFTLFSLPFIAQAKWQLLQSSSSDCSGSSFGFIDLEATPGCQALTGSSFQVFTSSAIVCGRVYETLANCQASTNGVKIFEVSPACFHAPTFASTHGWTSGKVGAIKYDDDFDSVLTVPKGGRELFNVL
ncbi:hypothetical protein BT69DRAFT_1299733 [Atractiella rhizophila]|nr:hypothetical protein BT69DRAFT_1299733 [Atractiella rhizophila]